MKRLRVVVSVLAACCLCSSAATAEEPTASVARPDGDQAPAPAARASEDARPEANPAPQTAVRRTTLIMGGVWGPQFGFSGELLRLRRDTLQWSILTYTGGVEAVGFGFCGVGAAFDLSLPKSPEFGFVVYPMSFLMSGDFGGTTTDSVLAHTYAPPARSLGFGLTKVYLRYGYIAGSLFGEVGAEFPLVWIDQLDRSYAGPIPLRAYVAVGVAI